MDVQTTPAIYAPNARFEVGSRTFPKNRDFVSAFGLEVEMAPRMLQVPETGKSR